MALLKLMTKTFAIGLGGYWALSNFPFLVFLQTESIWEVDIPHASMA
jgi:hypothetical protein